MYDLTLSALLIGVTNIGIAYGATEVWKLDYKSYIAFKVAAAFVIALVIKALAFAWKDRLAQSFKEEYQHGELLQDVILFLIIILVTAAITFYLVYRRYGVVGWLGAVAANVAVNWIV